MGDSNFVSRQLFVLVVKYVFVGFVREDEKRSWLCAEDVMYEMLRSKT